MALWLVWKALRSFLEWDRRDPLALKKLTLVIQVLALLAGTTAIIRLHLQAEKSRQFQTPKHPIVIAVFISRVVDDGFRHRKRGRRKKPRIINNFGK